MYSCNARRSEASPTKMSLERHSCRREHTQRSAKAFRLRLRGEGAADPAEIRPYQGWGTEDVPVHRPSRGQERPRREGAGLQVCLFSSGPTPERHSRLLGKCSCTGRSARPRVPRLAPERRAELVPGRRPRAHHNGDYRPPDPLDVRRYNIVNEADLDDAAERIAAYRASKNTTSPSPNGPNSGRAPENSEGPGSLQSP